MVAVRSRNNRVCDFDFCDNITTTDRVKETEEKYENIQKILLADQQGL